VIYELPTAWSRTGGQVGVGSFADVTALVDTNAGGANFTDLQVVQKGRSYLTELGVTALELLPPADSFIKGNGVMTLPISWRRTRNWGNPSFTTGRQLTVTCKC